MIFNLIRPDFFPTFFGLLKNTQSVLFRLRAFLALKMVIKDLTAAKKNSSRNQGQQDELLGISVQLTQFVASIWLSSTNDLLGALKSFVDAIQSNPEAYALANDKLGMLNIFAYFVCFS